MTIETSNPRYHRGSTDAVVIVTHDFRWQLTEDSNAPSMSNISFLCKGLVDDRKPSQKPDMSKVVNTLRINKYLLYTKPSVSELECSTQ